MAEMHLGDVIYFTITSCGLRVTDMLLVWVCEIELSHMGKKNGNPDLVCEKLVSYPSV